MKKTIFSLLLAAAPIISSAKEVVYLKNGSIIKGDIVEIVPNKTLTVETADGNTFVCNYDEIDKIAREKSENNEVIAKKSEDNEALATPKIKDNSSPLKRGYSWQINSAFSAGNETMYGLETTTIHGFRFNPKLFVGLGIGSRFRTQDWEEAIDIPFFVNFRYDLLDYKISPFLAVNSGVAFNTNNIEGTGYYGSLEIGCRFRHFSISTGIETSKFCKKGHYNINYYYWDYYWEDSYYYSQQDANFALRLGLVF